MAPTGWPPPAVGLPTHTSYWFSSRRSFRSCRVRLSLTRLHTARWSFSVDSPLRVCAYLLRSFVYTTGVLAPDKPALCVCVARACSRTRARARTPARKRVKGERARKRGERERENERKMMCAYAPPAALLLSSPLSERRSARRDRIEGDVSVRVKSTELAQRERAYPAGIRSDVGGKRFVGPSA